MMLDQIKALKIKAVKENTSESKLAKDAYTAVLSSVQAAQSKLVDGKLIVIDDAFVLGTIKKEIKIFRESVSNNPDVLRDYESKAKILEELLPKQLTKEDLLNLLLEFEGERNPKSFMKYLDELGHVGCYNKAIASSIILGK